MTTLLNQARGVTAIGRHSIKASAAVAKDTVLSEKGESRARWSGRNLPQGFVVSARAGELPRQRRTTELMLEAYPGFKHPTVVHEPVLGFQWFKDMKALEGMITEHGDAGTLAKWMNNEIPTHIVERPEVVGREVLKNTIGHTQSLLAAGKERPFVINGTSSWFDAVILKALGIDYRKITPNRTKKAKHPEALEPKKRGESLLETEALLFFHLPNGKIILKFRGKAFDVTKPLKKILE